MNHFAIRLESPLKPLLKLIIKEEEDTPTSNGKWEVFLLDISPNGMKIVSSTNINLPEDLSNSYFL